jgi:hypothetical protein
VEDEKRHEMTEAQLQIERLMKMKAEKDNKDKMKAEAPAEELITSRQAGPGPEERQMTGHAGKPQARRTRPPQSVRIEKRLYEKLHRIVRNISAGSGPKISKAKFINLVMKEFLALDIDYNIVKSKDEMKKLFERIKTGN